jgi:hypothetical protein
MAWASGSANGCALPASCNSAYQCARTRANSRANGGVLCPATHLRSIGATRQYQNSGKRNDRKLIMHDLSSFIADFLWQNRSSPLILTEENNDPGARVRRQRMRGELT